MFKKSLARFMSLVLLAATSTTRFSKVVGWPAGKAPAAAGLNVTAFAEGLDNPRWLYVLPNGDVLVSEAKTEKIAGDIPAEVLAGLRASGSLGKSANRITLLRDADRDGGADGEGLFGDGIDHEGCSRFSGEPDAALRIDGHAEVRPVWHLDDPRDLRADGVDLRQECGPRT